MQKVIEVEKLVHLLPHRKPMIWVDRVIEFSHDEGTVEVEVKNNSFFFSQGTILKMFYLEFMAQGYGYAMAAQYLELGNLKEKLKTAMIPMIDDYKYENYHPQIGDKLIAKVKMIKNMHPLYIITGNVENEQGEILAQAKFKVYSMTEELQVNL